MILLTHEDQWRGGGTVIAFGEFDGVHRGHAKLMLEAKSLAKQNDLSSVVYTYSNHPMAAFAPDRVPPQLNTLSEKIHAISKMDVDAAVLRPFDKAYASKSPEEFVQSFVETLHPRHVVIGFNYSFGCKGSGKAADMKLYGEKYGFETHIVDAVLVDDAPVSSTRIRAAIAKGDMEETTRLMGVEYTVSGVVQHGKQLGRQLGFPTANLPIPQGKALPPNGVYAAKAYVNDRHYMAALNIGKHPTAPMGGATLEANLLDYPGGDLYGQHMRLTLYKQLRPEVCFDSLEELKKAVMKNREQVENYFQEI